MDESRLVMMSARTTPRRGGDVVEHLGGPLDKREGVRVVAS